MMESVVAACAVEKKATEETEAQNDNIDVTPEECSAAADDDKQSRDVMTSSDPERGDSGADNRQLQTGSSPSADETAQTLPADDHQTDVQTTLTTSSSDGTTSTTTDRKANSDKPETETASSGAVFFSCSLTITVYY